MGVCAVSQSTLTGRLRTPCREWSARRTRCGAEKRGGLVAWQPPHRQDEDLVPLTAGACSPRRMSSRRIPRQTSRPDPSPHDGSGAASRRHRATSQPGPDATAGRPTGSRGEAALGCLRIGSEPICPPPGHALKSRPGSRPVDRPFERLAHCHRRTAQRPIRPAVSDRLVGPTSVGRRATSAAQRLWPRSTSAHWRGENRQERLLWVVCGRVGLATQQRPGSRPG